jgi:hypothetical protein
MIFLMTYKELLRYLKRYFPVSMGALFAQGLTLVIGIPMMIDSYFEVLPVSESLRYSYFSVLVASFLIAHCNFMVVRGYLGWICIPVILMLLCLVGVLPTIVYSPHTIFYVSGILFPLLALLLLNSKRHREARNEWVKLREERQRIGRIIRTQRQKNRRQERL